MKKIVLALIAMALMCCFCIVAFWLGYEYKSLRLGENDKYVLSGSMDITGQSGEVIGSIPKGTYLYAPKYRKVNKYYLFINVYGEANELLIPYEGEETNLIVPLSGGF